MSGYSDFNYPAFHTVAAMWRAEGWTVINPAENFDGDQTLAHEVYLKKALAQVLEVDAIAVLPGWQVSKGASIEVAVAQVLKLPVYDAKTFALYSETCLQEAQRLVYGSRQGAYGHPLDDYECTAQLFSAILGHEVSAEQAILCMIAVKVSRLSRNLTHRDSITDVAGYAECLQRVNEERIVRFNKVHAPMITKVA